MSSAWVTSMNFCKVPDPSVRKIISIVTPCFNEINNIQICYQRVKDLFHGPLSGYDREHIFCDNASNDGTVDILRAIAAKDHDVKIILNARNFGPMRSNFNGVLSATGDVILLFLPADLQDPPELLPRFVQLWEAGNEVVYGIRSVREEPWIMRLMRKIYYRLIKKLSHFEIPVDVGDFQLVDRKVLEAMRQFNDPHPFMRTMIFECGFNSVGVPYTWQARARGVSKNSLFDLFDQGLNGVISLSTILPRLGLFFGFVLACTSLVIASLHLIANIIFFREFALPGIATLIVAIFFFGGVQLLFIGFLGEYIIAIHQRIKGRPLVIERERINFKQQDVP